jgi:hypothetical protein
MTLRRSERGRNLQNGEPMVPPKAGGSVAGTSYAALRECGDRHDQTRPQRRDLDDESRST